MNRPLTLLDALKHLNFINPKSPFINDMQNLKSNILIVGTEQSHII